MIQQNYFQIYIYYKILDTKPLFPCLLLSCLLIRNNYKIIIQLLIEISCKEFERE